MQIIKEEPMSQYNAKTLTIALGEVIKVISYGRKYTPGEIKIGTKGTKYELQPGLFIYSGLGSGDYYTKNGSILSCTKNEACKLAYSEGVEYIYKDSLLL